MPPTGTFRIGGGSEYELQGSNEHAGTGNWGWRGGGSNGSRAEHEAGDTNRTCRTAVKVVLGSSADQNVASDLRYAIDCSKIEKELGWTPRESFATGFRKTIEWYLSNRPWVDRVAQLRLSTLDGTALRMTPPIKRQPKDYIIFPLDVPSQEEARRCVQMLADVVGMFKVGLELFVRCGPAIVEFIHSRSAAGVFLDLKLHDISATVPRTMSGVAALGVKFASVHCGEDPRMLAAAVTAGAGRVGVLAQEFGGNVAMHFLQECLWRRCPNELDRIINDRRQLTDYEI